MNQEENTEGFLSSNAIIFILCFKNYHFASHDSYIFYMAIIAIIIIWNVYYLMDLNPVAEFANLHGRNGDIYLLIASAC